MPDKPVVLRDSTLREGRDVPGVAFTAGERAEIAAALAAAGVREAEVVAPGHLEDDLACCEAIRRGTTLALTGLVYGQRDGWRADVAAAVASLDRVDILMPLSERRPPHGVEEKLDRLAHVVEHARRAEPAIGAGLPHAFQVSPDVVLRAAGAAVAAGADRVTLYDTNGGAEPSRVHELVGAVVDAAGVDVFFHGHDDLGLATANSWAAVGAGAAGLDVTVNGLGDRAGNASLEQVVVLLHLHGHATGIDATRLRQLSGLVEERSGVPTSPLAPVVGRFAFAHRSPAHLPLTGEFEAYDPSLIGTESWLA